MAAVDTQFGDEEAQERLGLVIETDVQARDALLAALGGEAAPGMGCSES